MKTYNNENKSFSQNAAYGNSFHGRADCLYRR